MPSMLKDIQVPNSSLKLVEVQGLRLRGFESPLLGSRIWGSSMEEGFGGLL